MSVGDTTNVDNYLL